jgi:hypothetical protein
VVWLTIAWVNASRHSAIPSAPAWPFPASARRKRSRPKSSSASLTRLGNPVRIDHDHIARTELDCSVVVRGGRIRANHQTVVFDSLNHAPAPEDQNSNRRNISGPACSNRAAMRRVLTF